MKVSAFPQGQSQASQALVRHWVLSPDCPSTVALPDNSMLQEGLLVLFGTVQHAWVLMTPRALKSPHVAQRTSCLLFVMMAEETKNKGRAFFDGRSTGCRMLKTICQNVSSCGWRKLGLGIKMKQNEPQVT